MVKLIPLLALLTSLCIWTTASSSSFALAKALDPQLDIPADHSSSSTAISSLSTPPTTPTSTLSPASSSDASPMTSQVSNASSSSSTTESTGDLAQSDSQPPATATTSTTTSTPKTTQSTPTEEATRATESTSTSQDSIPKGKIITQEYTPTPITAKEPDLSVNTESTKTLNLTSTSGLSNDSALTASFFNPTSSNSTSPDSTPDPARESRVAEIIKSIVESARSNASSVPSLTPTKSDDTLTSELASKQPITNQDITKSSSSSSTTVQITEPLTTADVLLSNSTSTTSTPLQTVSDATTNTTEPARDKPQPSPISTEDLSVVGTSASPESQTPEFASVEPSKVAFEASLPSADSPKTTVAEVTSTDTSAKAHTPSNADASASSTSTVSDVGSDLNTDATLKSPTTISKPTSTVDPSADMANSSTTSPVASSDAAKPTSDTLAPIRPIIKPTKDKAKFNYASFDCGALILASNSDASSSTSILFDGKDQYMLNKCNSQKFVVVELCDTILVDTIMLANFEYFSSMFKELKVSVAERYPPKDGWKLVGNFVAQNVRSYQYFTVQQPLIFSKYLRIDFVSHYGNEYYCPLTTIRVHGTTELDAFKAEEELAIESEAQAQAEAAAAAAIKAIARAAVHDLEPITSPLAAWTTGSVLPSIPAAEPSGTTTEVKAEPSTTQWIFSPDSFTEYMESHPMESPNSQTQSTQNASDTNPTPTETASVVVSTGSARLAQESSANQPTGSTQESIFKTIAKRLSLLERNATLSYKFIEEQSRAYHQAFTRIETMRSEAIARAFSECNKTLTSTVRELARDYEAAWGFLLRDFERDKTQTSKKLEDLETRILELNSKLNQQFLYQIVIALIGLVIAGSYFSSGRIEPKDFRFGPFSPPTSPFFNNGRYGQAPVSPYEATFTNNFYDDGNRSAASTPSTTIRQRFQKKRPTSWGVGTSSQRDTSFFGDTGSEALSASFLSRLLAASKVNGGRESPTPSASNAAEDLAQLVPEAGNDKVPDATSEAIVPNSEILASDSNGKSVLRKSKSLTAVKQKRRSMGS